MLRASPITLAGVVLAVLAILLAPRGVVPAGRSLTWSALTFALLFGLLMTFAAKNFDRYLLPIFPLLGAIAGIGWAETISSLAPRSRSVGVLGMIAVVSIHSGMALFTAPYYLTFFNPLAGGADRGARLIASGWGEGLDQVAAWLNAQPNPQRLRVGLPGEIYTTVLGSQTRAQVAPADAPEANAFDYLVVYVRNRQLGETSPAMDERYLPWQPAQVIRLHGIDYAWIYDTRDGAPVNVPFTDGSFLTSYSASASRVRPGQSLQVTTSWRGLSGGRAVQNMVAPSLDGPPVAMSTVQIRNEAADAPLRFVLNVDSESPAGMYVLAARVLDEQGAPIEPASGGSEGWVALRSIEIRSDRK
jgi:hypothetical protein